MKRISWYQRANTIPHRIDGVEIENEHGVVSYYDIEFSYASKFQPAVWGRLPEDSEPADLEAYWLPESLRIFAQGDDGKRVEVTSTVDNAVRSEIENAIEKWIESNAAVELYQGDSGYLDPDIG